MKIPAPNYTQTPNLFYDEIFRNLKEGELRVVLVLARQTFGWHKSFDRISLSQLAKKSGMVRTSVCRSLASVIEKGLVIQRKFGPPGKEKSYYSLVMESVETEESEDDEEEMSEEEMELLSNNFDQSPKETTPVSLGDYPQSPKETHKRNSSKENDKKKQQQDSAAVFSQKVEKKGKTKTYPILETVDIADRAKQTISKNYEEKTAINAVEWATHPKNPPWKSFEASIIYACNNRLSASKFEVRKKSIYEMVNEYFKNGQTYNGAECILTAECIAFQRGMNHAQMRLDKFFLWGSLIELCDRFGIKFGPWDKK